MEKYIRVYMDFFGYDIAEDIIFEVTGGLAKNIHHLNGRIGKNKEDINGLIALRYDLHDAIHTGKSAYSKNDLIAIHIKFMRDHGKK